ncbi:DUF882 domain-containing protein [Methylocella sp.]|uniref:DUF882 domain-containing protein n=1 Tax=Methylocella sp. TaxID=1978226 RepID=UPI0035B38E91
MRSARRLASRQKARRLAAAAAAGLAVTLAAGSSTETAEANGDTRTLYLLHSHTGETIAATFRVNGSYDPAVLAQLNHFLRDWRNDDQTRMDPRLFDVVWEVYRTAGATQPIVVYSAYRSPETNAMLRRRSKAVAEYSQHILGKAMDTTMPGMSMEQIREIGMKLQRGGVGYYARENFVHLDVGGVRSWPRMGYDQLARLFPDGKSAHIAANGKTLPRYEEARAEIAARGGAVDDAPVQMAGGGFFSWLFGAGRDRQEQAEADRGAAPARAPTQVAALEKPARMSAAERRAAARLAREAPAVAAIEAANNRPDEARPADRTLLAALAPQPPAAQAPAAPPAPAPVVAQAPVAAPAAPATQSRFAAAPVPPPPERPAPAREAAPAKLVAEASEPAARDRREDDARAVLAKALLAAPVPPARPAAPAEPAVLAYADAPLPPARPRLEVAALAPAAAQAAAGPVQAGDAGKTAAILARAASLPVVITRGPKDRQAMPSTVLGYASDAGASRLDGAPQIVSARLDRSNFAELTSDTPAAEAAPSSLLGEALTGLRRAARVVPDLLAAAPSAGYRMIYGAATSVADAAQFSKIETAEAQAAPPALDDVKISDVSAR